MDKIIKAAQLLALVLISLASLVYIWRQHYDYQNREEAWYNCSGWARGDGKQLLKPTLLLVQECMRRIRP